MNLGTPDEEFGRWLDTATSRLPSQVGDWVRDELQAHYEDAAEAHRARGLDDLEASRLALQELGDPRLTASGLGSTHLTRQDCLVAVAICLLYPAALLFVPMLSHWLDYYQTNLLVFLSTAAVIVYILSAYRALIRGRVRSVDRPVRLVSIAQILWAAFAFVYYVLYRGLPLLGSPGVMRWPLSTPGTALLAVGLVAADVTCGIGVLWLGRTLLREAPASLPQARKIAWLLVALGGINLAGNLSAALGWSAGAFFTSALGDVVMTTGFAVIAFLFWTSATRGGIRSRARSAAE